MERCDLIVETMHIEIPENMDNHSFFSKKTVNINILITKHECSLKSDSKRN